VPGSAMPWLRRARPEPNATPGLTTCYTPRVPPPRRHSTPGPSVDHLAVTVHPIGVAARGRIRNHGVAVEHETVAGTGPRIGHHPAEPPCTARDLNSMHRQAYRPVEQQFDTATGRRPQTKPHPTARPHPGAEHRRRVSRHTVETKSRHGPMVGPSGPGGLEPGHAWETKVRRTPRQPWLHRAGTLDA
jgi:hypothetical protein